VLLLLDEAGRTAVPHLSDYASTVCGRGISLWIAVQDLSQLDGIYGRHKAKTLCNNCDTQIYYRPNDLETAKYLEESLGRKSDYATSHTSRQGTETSEGKSEQGIPLMTAWEIKQLKDDDIIGFYSDLKPFRAKRMDWRKYKTLIQRLSLPAPQIPTLPPLAPLPPTISSKEGEEAVEETEKNISNSEEGFLNTLTNPDKSDSSHTDKTGEKNTKRQDVISFTVWVRQNSKKQNQPANGKRTKIQGRGEVCFLKKKIYN
jgi:type IV secretory pathway TraG/TraD family ATPase VirD4